MKIVLKNEIKRAFKEKFFYLALLLGMVITISHIFSWSLKYWNYMANLDEYERSFFKPASVFDMWIGGCPVPWQAYTYYILIPLIAAIPYGISLHEDRKSGYMKNMILRSGRKNYYLGKYIANFIAGGLAVVIPLMLNFFINCALFPAYKPEVVGLGPIGLKSMFYKVFYTHPIVYILIFFLMDFIYAGLYANITLIFSEIVNYKYIVMLGPIFVVIFTNSILELYNKSDCSSTYFLMGSSSKTNGLFVFGEAVILFIITFGYILYRGRHEEII